MVTTQRILVRLFPALAACSLILAPAAPAFSGWLDAVKEMKIGEKMFPVCPDDYLVQRGFPVRQVADEQNAAIECTKAINLYVEPPEGLASLYDYVRTNGWIPEAEALLPWLEQNAPAIAAIVEAAKKDDCKFPVFGESGTPLWDVLLPHLSKMRNLARLLATQGKYLEHQGKYREALDTYLLIAKMGYLVSKEPILISGLVGIACDSIAARAIESCILRNRLDTKTLDYLLQRSDAFGKAAQNYQISISGERVFGLSMVDDLFKRPKEMSGVFGGTEGKALSAVQALFATTHRSLGLRAIMKSDFRRYWNEMDKWNELPAHVAFRPENISGDKIIDELPFWSLARMLLPALSRARISFVRAEAVKAILTTQVALEIFKVKNGSYPEKLDQLGGILKEVPKDPFANEPLKYKRTEDGYIVYSVGENLADDGGEGGPSRYEPDIVARSPLPEPEPFKPAEQK